MGGGYDTDRGIQPRWDRGTLTMVRGVGSTQTSCRVVSLGIPRGGRTRYQADGRGRREDAWMGARGAQAAADPRSRASHTQRLMRSRYRRLQGGSGRRDRGYRPKQDSNHRARELRVLHQGWSEPFGQSHLVESGPTSPERARAGGCPAGAIAGTTVARGGGVASHGSREPP